MQAACLHPILREKVRAWALASSGMFPSADRPTRLMRLAPPGGGGGEAEHGVNAVKFARIKSVSRAIEKVRLSRPYPLTLRPTVAPKAALDLLSFLQL